MRAVRALTGGFGVSAEQPWLPGLPHVAAALATYFVFGGQACVTGLLLATLASFVVFLPVTALALNGGRAIAADGPAPVITTRAQIMLLGLWTATAWAGAAVAGLAA
ncbi:MAG: hypothetical protein QOH05_3582 [Acetobacteraceae bacterium]|jgi:hypothetical protein|nr:hypothetical protein [Acetobacteraceae bacterium]